MKIIIKLTAITACLISLILLNSHISSTDIARKRVENIIRRDYPSYHIDSLEMQYVDFFSSVREADYDDKPTLATVVISNRDEQRTIHFEKELFLWCIEKNAPDYGPNVPEDEYFIDINWNHVGIMIDIDECVKDEWVIPNENGELYYEDGISYTYYTYQYIRDIFRTQNGRIYAINKKTLEWEPSEITYSYLDYFSNYRRISKEEAEEIISAHSRKDE